VMTGSPPCSPQKTGTSSSAEKKANQSTIQKVILFVVHFHFACIHNFDSSMLITFILIQSISNSMPIYWFRLIDFDFDLYMIYTVFFSEIGCCSIWL
jgi:uncharacterized membrane protein (DUF485 family)